MVSQIFWSSAVTIKNQIVNFQTLASYYLPIIPNLEPFAIYRPIFGMFSVIANGPDICIVCKTAEWNRFPMKITLRHNITQWHVG